VLDGRKKKKSSSNGKPPKAKSVRKCLVRENVTEKVVTRVKGEKCRPFLPATPPKGNKEERTVCERPKV